ncbi:MAG: phenylacetate-CoA oxygenase subunit PaaC [Sediminibacterium sp.]
MDQSLFNYTLHLADNALIIGHRNSEWCGHGPVLEQDIAIANIALDLIGQARNFYQYAAILKAGGTTEDDLAYLRDTIDFKNLLLTELPKGNWAQTILRQFFFSVYQYFLYQQLQQSTNTSLAAIAEKALKEVTYHVRWSSEWVIRLGDGTAESKSKMEEATADIWNYTGEIFLPVSYETDAWQKGYGADLSLIKEQWNEKIMVVFEEATLKIPAAGWVQQGGKKGIHTEHLGFILAEMQFLQRAYPGATW